MKCAALLVVAQQISCTGGSSAAGNPNTSDPAPIVVRVTPASAQVAAGGRVQFIATVENSSNSTVTWQVNGLAGGNSTAGTIASAGLATASYDAPTSVPSPATVSVAAVLQADQTKFGSASVTITPLPGPTLTISPGNPSVAVNGILQFTASVQNSSSGVSWEINHVSGGNSIIGRITSSDALTATYQAPAQVPNVLVTVTAALIADPTVTSSTTVTVTPAPPPTVSVTVSPPTASVGVSQTLQFTATVQNSSSAVNWEVNGLIGGDATIGSISASGLYKAPSVIPNPAALTVTAVLQTDSTIFGSAGVTITLSTAFPGIFSWRNDTGLTGQNQQETVLTPATVPGGTFGKLFSCPVDGYVYAQPLYVPNVAIGGLTRNVVYVATEHDSVFAFDADANPCQQLWQMSFLSVGVTTVCQPNCLLDVGSDGIVPEIGITGTPVIDPKTGTLYVVAEAKENGSYVHRLHALDIVTGTEKFGGPVKIQASVPGTGDDSNGVPPTVPFNGHRANQRAALALARDNAGKTYICIAYASHGDTDPYHGWLLAYDAANLNNQLAAFNTTPDGNEGGIWQSGAAPSVDVNGNIFVVAANGKFDANSAAPPNKDYGETLLRLQIHSTSAAFDVIDTFTPFNQGALSLRDNDFGSTGVLLLPDAAGSPSHAHLAVAGGKEGKLYLLDRDHLGGYLQGLNGTDNVVQTLCINTGGIYGTPAYFQGANAIYVAAAYDYLKAFPLTNGTLPLPNCPLTAAPSSQSSTTFSFPGASPAISSNGLNNGIVWALDTSGFGTSSPAILHAYDATNLNELYISPTSGSGAAGPAVKFTVPTVANGKVYVGTQNELSVFGLP